MKFAYPDEPTYWKQFQNDMIAAYEDAGRAFPDPNDPDAYRRFSRCGYDIGFGLDPALAARKHIAELKQELGATPIEPPPPGEPTARPLVGPLRIQDKLFRDDQGFRRVLFCSWFPALRILRDNPQEFERQINAIASAGYQGIRVFLAVGGWSDYWDGREVVPIRFQKATFDGNHLRPVFNGPWLEAWPDYDDLLRTLLRACRARKLRLHVTCGDMQIIDRDGSQELALHRRFAEIIAAEGGAEVVSLYEVTNEFPLNRYGGDSAPSIEQMGRVIAVVDAILPNVLTAQGAIPQNEDPAALSKASTHGDVCAVHVTRDPFGMCMKHTYGIVYWEGNYRSFPKPFWEGEPAGPGQDSYARQDDPANLTAVYAAHALSGQASVRFQGAAVRSRQPLESEWGFYELPKMLSILPEDVATWPREHAQGGIEYWVKGNRFFAFTTHEWDTKPPRAVEDWTLFMGNEIRSGVGDPVRGTGLLAGNFK
jgi:hypothetical protein